MTKRTNLMLLGLFATTQAARRPSHLTRRYVVCAVVAAVLIAATVWFINRQLPTQVPTTVR